MCSFFTCMSIFSPPFRKLEQEIRRPTRDTVTTDDYYIISQILKKNLHFYGKYLNVVNRQRYLPVPSHTHWEELQKPRSCPAGRQWRRRSICDLLCSSQSVVGGDDRRVATKLGQSPRSPGSRTKRMVSRAEKLAAVRELPAHNQ